MNEKIIKQMCNIVADVMTSFQSDFENYDKPYIESAKESQFPMIWIVGKSHTYLLKLGNYENKFFENEAVRLAYVQGDNGFDYYLEMSSNDNIFLIEKKGVSKISVKQAENVANDFVCPAVAKWEQSNGPLPKRCKVKVRLNNISIGALKQMIHECEAHGDVSLLRALKRFHNYRQISLDHYIQVSYNSYYNEFAFCEFCNGKQGLVGGIIFHGWKETGYKENYSVQLMPAYGWQIHT